VNASLEFGWRRGNLMAQGQYVRMMLDREDRPDPDFDGWYLEGSWIPTGEERRYSRSAGLFGPVTPKTNKGAWEIRARYSVIDLTDKTVSGGVERDASLGVTWWRTSKIRFMFEYINAVADPDFDDDDQIADILQARIQFAI
jgi:phosphate-selective porin OprO/OprP